ncbi:MAG: type VI secretion system tip protein TssI/VgrG, partial [Caldimonas sp.]
MTFKSTLGDDAFLALGMEGTEILGRLPEYWVDLAGGLDLLGKPKKIDLHDLLGTRATVSMAVDPDNPRHFNGFVTRMQRGERMGRYEGYLAQLRPWPWFMTRTINSRIFQAQSIKEILTKVLTEYSGDHDLRLIGTYPKLDYCVQYRETDFDFVGRLMEEAGIYYFFEHAKDKHTMVLVDSMAKHKSKDSKSPIRWANALKQDGSVIDWRSYEEARTVKVTVGDYDYLAPATKIEATKTAVKAPSKLGTMEVYEHPADVVQN